MMRRCQKAADFCTCEARRDYSDFHAKGKQPPFSLSAFFFFFFKASVCVHEIRFFPQKAQYGQNMLKPLVRMKS